MPKIGIIRLLRIDILDQVFDHLNSVIFLLIASLLQLVSLYFIPRGKAVSL